MAAADVLKRVLQLKHQLTESSESKTIMKTLKRLQDLDITLNILAETGIGKAVNAFRKHVDAGEVAKRLVIQWKKLVPKESTSLALEQSGAEGSQKEEERCFDGKSLEPTSPKTESKPEGSYNKSKVTSRNQCHGSNTGLYAKRALKQDQTKKASSPKSVDCPAGESKLRANSKQNVHEITKGQESKRSSKDKKSDRVKETALDSETEVKAKKSSNEQKILSSKNRKLDTNESKRNMKKMGNKGGGSANESEPSEDEFAKPTMSFESYLSYDLKAPKRKKKPYNTKEAVKKPKITADRVELSEKTTVGQTRTELIKCFLEEPPKKPSTASVMELLSIPLPKFLPECEELTSFPYFDKKSAAEDVVSVVSEVAPIFTGQRLNRKMQVYSGAKTNYLPAMMSLYQQCLRALQNNIDLLYEIGGVPFEILEPVLERCTPKQLLRIEECNPVYIGETDHLWERHCQRDFRNGKLEEYESWREMHLRLSEERERKLQKLTESIVSAHSGKPKGRQVKLAFINSVAKPPRHVRIQQELHGTASSGAPPNPLDRPRSTHPMDQPSTKTLDSRRLSSSEVTASTSQGQDPKKLKRVAPMMAKSLKAFKKQLGRR
ncbi:hypothetical protein JZ751_010874 [Albula glossodonta]|uniref:Elongin-A n=1 Tax=Albula glossodonta TaxID=121402 RepID=A0A8T2NV36_9TELE|nr:hypothetical protein JZ751_010874 [Albula glossodonta]